MSMRHLFEEEGALQKQADHMQPGGRSDRHLVQAVAEGPLLPGPAATRVEGLPAGPL